MTNVLPAFDASCSTPSALVPLDFSSLLQYSDAAASSFLLSPLCAATVLRSPLLADPFLKSPLLSVSPISPLSSSASALGYLQTPSYPVKPAYSELQRPASPTIHIPAPSVVCTASSTSLVTPQVVDSPMTDAPESFSATTALTATSQSASHGPAAPVIPKETGTSTVATTAINTSSSTRTCDSETPSTNSSSSKAPKPISAIDKAAERRRKNRESSSRCYYNRKRIIQNMEKQLVAEKDKLTKLYDRALQLRHDNARLKKEVVTNGYALPTSRTKYAYSRTTNSFSLRDYLRLLHSSTYQNPSHVLL